MEVSIVGRAEDRDVWYDRRCCAFAADFSYMISVSVSRIFHETLTIFLTLRPDCDRISFMTVPNRAG